MESVTLPMKLEEGLILRQASAEDSEALAAFNIRIQSDDPNQPEMWLGDWTRDLMLGQHPTTSAEDFIVVVNEAGEIVSTLCLISQTWQIGSVTIPVGRVELVGTDERYRRRGLVRRQMELIHARSAAKGESVQAITGIPWYYRMFGYDMALDLSGGRAFFWVRKGNDVPTAETDEPYTLRQATLDDIPDLERLYATQQARTLVWRLRSEVEWRHEMGEGSLRDDPPCSFWLIDSAETRGLAYIEYQQWGNGFVVRELGVSAGHSWRSVALFVTRTLKRLAVQKNETRKTPIEYVSFRLGRDHAVYTALGSNLEKQQMPYAYYMRVAELPAFLRRLTPVLEQRIAKSVLVGHSGKLRLNLYTQHIEMLFEQGRLREIGTFEPTHNGDGDVLLPDLTILQLLFGRRDIDQLNDVYADCYPTSAEAEILMRILFPVQASQVVAL